MKDQCEVCNTYDNIYGAGTIGLADGKKMLQHLRPEL